MLGPVLAARTSAGARLLGSAARVSADVLVTAAGPGHGPELRVAAGAPAHQQRGLQLRVHPQLQPPEGQGRGETLQKHCCQGNPVSETQFHSYPDKYREEAECYGGLDVTVTEVAPGFLAEAPLVGECAEGDEEEQREHSCNMIV